MKTDHREGDSYTDRLFHWLQYKHDIPITIETVIKPKVFQVNMNGRKLLLKGYRRAPILQQQLDFFKEWTNASQMASCPIPFPDHTFTKSKLGCEWGLFEWLEGRHADFRSHSDRKQAGRLVKLFHRTTEGITALSIPRDPLYVKWERRLEQFKETKSAFSHYQKSNIFHEIVTVTDKQLNYFADHNWGEIEERAWENHDWLHGDLAHHNFIVDENNHMKLIDFDLLHNGPRLYDEIQLAHRFLPYLEDQRRTLLNYFRHSENNNLWLEGVLVPADLLREWLYGYKRCRAGEGSLAVHINKLEIAWEQRKMFVRYAENMLK
ncbi:aminoglycoside phosphotransferase family protein [Halobacillus salinarum]|uniref:Aminoglycoside phosphotransferase family protein n=1 Tax=Halobacillus salinarum TaxID=2932257 RepID=A0ABY4EQW2_9BACI|nr:aminoglycoside phosphotransferase family protein [Halobacillus salinarum]UOQ46263.1 aminoglycoside phosphotransferase family protein [Halobacillus salinarum]